MIKNVVLLRGIMIENRLFSQHFLPKYYTHNHFPSFMSQFYNDGFKKQRGSYKTPPLVYSHFIFIKENYEGLQEIKRKSKMPANRVDTNENVKPVEDTINKSHKPGFPKHFQKAPFKELKKSYSQFRQNFSEN